MYTPYEKTVDIAVTAGQDNYVAIPFIHRGQITKFVVEQLTGVDAGFALDLFNSEQPSLGATHIEQYKIMPTQSVVSGPLEIFKETNGFEFRNIDGTYSVPKRFVHLRMHPGGTGAKTYRVTLLGVPSV